jgi:hypothetical protein
MTKRDKPLLNSDEWHDKRFFSTKPPHDVIRVERCNCSGAGTRGWCNGGHESP